MSEVNRSTMASGEADVVAFHRGPANDFRFPEPAPRTAAQRLMDDESRFLDLAIERHCRGENDLAALARSIIVQRAAVADAAAKGKSNG
jgi:hypothetical protein